MRKIAIFGLVMLALFVVAPLGSASEDSSDGPYPPPEPGKGWENIEHVLYQLVESENREGFAENRGLFYENGRVRVILELENAGNPPDGVTVETSHDNLVQALVPVDYLLDLSRDANVLYIRSPLTAHLAGEETRVEVSVETEENVYAVLTMDGENVWVEIQGITVRRRFEDVESAIGYVEEKYRIRTNTLLGNDYHLRERLEEFGARARRRDEELREGQAELEERHGSLNSHFLSFVASTHERLEKLEFKIDFLYFAFSVLAVALSAIVLFLPELSGGEGKSRSDMRKELEEIHEKVRKFEREGE